eukprot:jgi/Botrbrau1/5492/Bobra.27_1s0030.1
MNSITHGRSLSLNTSFCSAKLHRLGCGWASLRVRSRISLRHEPRRQARPVAVVGPVVSWLTSTASISRVLTTLPYRNMGRVLTRVARPTGPLSLVLLLFTVLGAALAALRQYVLLNVKECKSCRGFGIQRCVLCGGDGYLNWEAKLTHTKEPCPRCLGRRFINCRDCGGHVHRPLFAHTSRIRSQGDDFYGAPVQPAEKEGKTGRNPRPASSRPGSGSGSGSYWED